jgi:sugar lactone lactonase YvrE
MEQRRVQSSALCALMVSFGAFAGLACAATPPAAPASGCSPDGALHYVCGPVNAEDLARIGNTRWLVTSGMDGPLNGGAPARGHLYLVDHQAKSWVDWFPGAAPASRHDTRMFKECPGPIDTSSFSAHGLSVHEQSANRFRLYVTGHGAREAIEIFDVETAGARPAITWIGCVVLPDKVSSNSVTVLPDGGFVTSQFMNRSLPMGDAFSQVTRGEVNGMLYEWHPGGKVEPIAGTELSGANGIAASADGRTIFVAAYGSGEVVRFERGTGQIKKTAVKVDITPDNLRWAPDGKLLAAGGMHGAPGSTAWAVLEIDPKTLAVRRVAGGDRLTGMRGVTVGAKVGNEMWLGTFSGDRIGYVTLQ